MQVPDAESIESTESAESADQYLTFLLGKEEYAVEILKIQEIKSWGAYTPLPNSPDYLLGVMNLRGAIVPIVDLRIRFRLTPFDYTSTTAVIIVHVQDETQTRVVGLVVDRVTDVYHLCKSNIQERAETASREQGDYILGLGEIEGKMVILLDLEPLVSSSLDELVIEQAA